MYCTLQEAYNVPSFDGGSKKKKSACNVKPSAEPYDTAPGQRAAVVEGFQSGKKTMSQEETPVTYRGQASDYEYYRKEYGINLPRIEGFQGAEQASCGVPASPPVYKVPISNESKEAYENAIATSLNEEVPRYTPPTPEVRKVDMSKVSGYYDEELEQYLLSKDVNAAPFVTLPPPSRVEVEPVVREEPRYEPHRPINTELIQPPPPEVPKEDTNTIISNESWQNFWDMFLFIFAGLLVMFLCEQLFKLAMMVGMKRTVDMLEPYLK